MTVSEMIRVYKMDMDQFETFAISKGYEFYRFERNEEKYNGICYIKGVGNETKYITHHDKYFSYGSHVNYQTGNTNEILNLKKQIKSLGYKLFNSSFIKNNIKEEIYRNTTFELVIYTHPPNDEYNSVWYEIGFLKF